MTKMIATYAAPSLVQPLRVSSPVAVAPATGVRRIAGTFNAVSSFYRKMVFARCNPIPATQATNDESPHYFTFRTGENVSSVVAWIGMQAATSADGTNRAYCQMELYDGTNTPVSTVAYLPIVSTTLLGITWHRVVITTDDTEPLLANTEYRGRIRQRYYARVFSVAVYEEAGGVSDSTVTGVCNPKNWEINNPIYDDSVQDIAETGTKLWQHNGAHLIGWSRKSGATAPNVTGTTEVNLLDTTITGGTWAAANPGFVLNTQYHDSQGGDVPVVLGVYATRTAGTTGNLTVRIKRNGSTIITGTITPAASPFHSSTHTITARASDKVDITIAAAAGDTWRVDALGLWEYEA